MTLYRATAEGQIPMTPEEEAEFLAEQASNATTLQQIKNSLTAKVDDYISNIYFKWARFRDEYIEREAAARAFKDGGYVGDPGIWVSSFATNSGKTNQQAADLIIAQADALRSALEDLGALRMQKYEIFSAESSAAAQAKYSQIVADANTIAATLS